MRQYDLSDYQFAMKNTKYNAQGRAVIETDDDWKDEYEWDDIFEQVTNPRASPWAFGEVWLKALIRQG